MFSPTPRPRIAVQQVLCALSIALGLLGCTSPPKVQLAPDADCFREIAGALADDAFGGRGLGSEGLRGAGDYLERLYSALGLSPFNNALFSRSYRQGFQAVTGIKSGPHNLLSWRQARSETTGLANIKTDFMPLGISSSAIFEGDLAFVGYGLVAEPLDYDDYEGLDLQGKVALAMRYEPGEADPDSPFDGKRPSRFSDLRYKALKARQAGAVALIFVSPPGDDEDRLPRVNHRGSAANAGIPVLQVSRKLAQVWLALAGLELGALHAAIDADYRPHSRDLPGLRISGRTDLKSRYTEVANIIGIVPGHGDLAAEAIVVGAHFDHLGRGGAHSLAIDNHAIHNGADDNASGVAAMICGVAGLMQNIKDDSAGEEKPRRSLVVVGFSGEEAGLLGSGWYVRHPVFPMEKTMAMVNLDMVGRLREEKLHAMGADSSPDWKPILAPLAQERGLDLLAGGDGYGPSDQMSFYANGVPVVHFFTGSHSDYHTPDDDIDRLNISGGARIAEFLGDVLGQLIHRTEPLAYQASSSAATMAGDSRNFGAFLGSIPDYSAMTSADGGVLLSAVRPGGPADSAGIAGGDRIIEMAGTEIHNLYDMTFVLSDHRPGEIIQIVVLRGGETLTLTATLGRRGKASGPKNVEASSEPADPHGQDD